MPRTLSIFVSSPGDVGQERVIAQRVITRLQGEFGGSVTLSPILWEHEPVRATSSFQEQIIAPSGTDIVVCILWSRLGTRLPEGFRRRPDGTSYESGTAFEFEDAQRSFWERRVPDLLVYRKTAEPLVSLRDPGRLRQQQEQWVALEAYLKRWFWNADGTFKAGFTQFETVEEFERSLEAHLRRLIQDKLEAAGVVVSEGGGAVTWHRGSPFRGLEAFEFEHAAVFFGRTRPIGEIREALAHQAAQGHAFVLVFGMSGSGKSSLARAGVLPILTQPGVIEGVGLWRWCAFRPGDAAGDLCGGLARSLVATQVLPEIAAAGIRLEDLTEAFSTSPQQAIPQLRIGLRRAAENEAEKDGLAQAPEARLALLVDQMEELFTLDWVDDKARQGFVEALSALASSGLVWVVGTMRSDFYHRCAQLPALASLAAGSGQYHLLPPRRAELAQMIGQPARAAGLAFEIDPNSKIGLDAVIEEAAARDPAALPLLEFTLEELFKLRTDDRLLTFESYERLGGLEGALARRAEEVFAGLESTVQEELPAVLAALVTVDVTEDKPAAARRAPWATIASTPESQALVETFVEARLFVTDRADDNGAVVRVAHEALLQHWPRLQTWIAENSEFLRTRARVEVAAARWQQEDRDTSHLLAKGKPLAEAEHIFSQRRADLAPLLIEFIAASTARVRRARIQRLAVAFVLFALAVVAAGTFAFLWEEAEEARQITLRRALAAEALNHQADRLDLALLLSLEATRSPDLVDLKGNLLQVLQSEPRLLQYLRGHTGAVRSVAFDPDGATLATASDDATIILWNLAKREILDELLLSAGVFSVVFSPDGKILASGSADKRIVLWNTDTRKPFDQPLIGHSEAVRTLAFSPDGKFLASGGADESIILWDVAKRAQVGQTLSGHQHEVTSVAFSPDGETLASGDDGGNIILWNLSNREPISNTKMHDGWLMDLAFSPGGDILASGGADDRLFLTDTNGRDLLGERRSHKGWVRSVAFSPDGKILASGSQDQSIVLWDVDARQPDGEPLIGHGSDVVSLAFHPDGKTLVSGGGDGAVILWDTRARQRLGEVFKKLKTGVRSLALSPDGGTLASGGEDKTVVLWKVSDGKQIGEPLRGHEDLVRRVTFGPDGTTLASASNDQTVILWNTATGQKTSQLKGHSDEVMAVQFSKDGQLLASGGKDNSIIIWNVSDGEKRFLNGHGFWVLDVDFDPDGRLLASASWDRSARIWKLEGGESTVLRTLRDNTPLDLVRVVQFDNTGQILALGGFPNYLAFWDVTNGVWLADPLRDHTGVVRSLSFSSDGRILATGSEDETIILWDVKSRRPLGLPLTGHEYIVNSVAFSPDNTILWSSSGNGVIMSWDVGIDSWRARACSIANRNLTPAEWKEFLEPEPYQKTCPALP